MRTIFTRLKGNAFTFPLAVVTALILLIISETAYHSSVSSLDELGRRDAARIDSVRLMRLMLEAENGQLGYLVTGHAAQKALYQSARDNVAHNLTDLEAHFSESPRQTQDFTLLRNLVDQKLSEMDTTITLRDEGRDEAWRSVAQTGIGQEQMAAIRQMTRRLVERETQLISESRAEVYKTQMLNRLGVSAMAAVSVLAFFMFLRQAATLQRERAEQRDALRAERDLLEKQVLVRTQQLTQLAQHLQNAREDERSRLARDLHDELGALLTAAKLDVARLRSKLGADIPPDIRERLSHLTEALNNGIALKRRIIEDLRPSSLSNLGLVAALEILAREFGERSGLDVHCRLEALPLSPSSELTIYRVVQEALTNVAKYAQARTVTILLKQDDSRAVVSVEDDGVGFDPHLVRPSTHGLLGMRYRVEAERGQMSIRSAPGEGSLLQASLPLQPMVAKTEA